MKLLRICADLSIDPFEVSSVEEITANGVSGCVLYMKNGNTFRLNVDYHRALKRINESLVDTND